MPNSHHGCCADKACTDANCMALPAGKTCGDCAHVRRCSAMFGHTATDTYCDWFPRLFRQRVEPTAPFGIPGQPATTAGVPLPAAQSDPQQSPMTSKEGGRGHG